MGGADLNDIYDILCLEVQINICYYNCINIIINYSSQCFGTLHALAWASPTSGGELFFDDDRCRAYNDRCQGKWICLPLIHVFRITRQVQ